MASEVACIKHGLMPLARVAGYGIAGTCELNRRNVFQGTVNMASIIIVSYLTFFNLPRPAATATATTTATA